MIKSLRDVYGDRYWDSDRGVMVGVTYGGTVHQPTTTYSDIPSGPRIPDPGPKYGEYSPPIINDFRKKPDSSFGILTPPGSTEQGKMEILTPPGSTEKGKFGVITPPGSTGSTPPDFSSYAGNFEEALENLFLRRFLEERLN